MSDDIHHKGTEATKIHTNAPGLFATGHDSRGQSLVELTVLLPLVLMIILGTADLGRVFYARITVDGAAQKGALYGSSSSSAAVNLSAIQSAVLADTTTLFGASPSNPTITSSTGTDPYDYQTVTVAVDYVFSPIFSFPNLPGAFTFSRSVKMRVKP